MSKKITLFNESDQEDAESSEFRTNKSYAKHYDEFRRKEIIGQLKNVCAEESSDSSDDETTDEEIVDPDFDKEFFRTLAFLKRKDPNKYTEQQTFFENVKPVEEVALAKRHHKEKPLTLKDYERKIILEKDGVYEDEEDIDPTSHRTQRAPSPSLVEQEKIIKDEIKQALSKINDSGSDGEEKEDSNLVGRGGGLLKERTKSKDEHEKEQADYIQWLADRKVNEPPSEDVKVLEPLKHFWSNAKLSKEDAFLKDYILNKRFIQTGDTPSYDDIVAPSEDEEELEKQEDYERKYNFRFEEPDSDFVKRYPRTMVDSMRIERNKRKEQRQALKERKQKEKEQQRRELEELKAVKLLEIKERIQRLKEIAATEKLAMNEEDLDSDFDPDAHDRRMQQMFNDEYYGVDEGDEKPEFPDLDEELGIENYDRENIDGNEEADGAEPYCEDDDFVMDCDYEEKIKDQSGKESFQQELLDSTRSRKKKGRRQSKFRQMLQAEKPLFDPEDEKTYGEYIDEYYKLDYEDIIGDTPCRFKYVETVPNDFGLSIEEILSANTRELNRWASVKKTVQLRPKQTELKEIEVYRRKSDNEMLKRKLLPSLFTETDINEDEDAEIKEQKQDIPATELTSSAKKNAKQMSLASKPTNEKRKNKLKAKVPFTETDNIDATPIKEEKTKKKLKKPNLAPKSAVPKEKSSIIGDCNVSLKNELTMSAQKSKSPSDERSKNEPTIDPSQNRKRPSNAMSSTSSTEQRKRTCSGSKKEVFKANGRSNGQCGDGHGKRNASNKRQSASDQRLRAFGLNPKKFHNMQKYGNRQRQNGSIVLGDNKPLNKKIKFE